MIPKRIPSRTIIVTTVITIIATVIIHCLETNPNPWRTQLPKCRCLGPRRLRKSISVWVRVSRVVVNLSIIIITVITIMTIITVRFPFLIVDFLCGVRVHVHAHVHMHVRSHVRSRVPKQVGQILHQILCRLRSEVHK